MHRSHDRGAGRRPFAPSPRSSRVSLGRRALPLVPLVLGFFIGEAAWAQGPNLRFHVSTTADTTVGTQPTLDDVTLIAAGAGLPPQAHFAPGHWQAVTGLVPGDLDGFGRRPGVTPGSAASYAFSIQSNEGGFLDGDVLGLAPLGGWEIIVSEDQILGGLGVPTANIDVDAVDFDGSGRLLFSLQANLPGTVLGDVEDGAVLRMESDGTVTQVFSEPEVQTLFTMATGLTASIVDVQAIEFWGGELLVVTQGPSSHDGGVLSCASVPYVFTDEAAMGLGGAELDALSEARAGDDIPCFVMSADSAAAGDTLQVDVSGRANTLYLVLMSGGVGTYDFSRHPGFGAWYFDLMDPWLLSIIGSPGTPKVVLDSQGKFSASWVVPTAMVYGAGFAGEDGWSFQIMDVATRELSAPFRVTRQ